MILADKIIQLRKQRDWSQEELAQKIGVSRQTVSAWETSQSSPEISHIIALSNLLGVSTDYLLRDDMEELPPTDAGDSFPSLTHSTHRQLSLEGANAFLAAKENSALPMAIGCMLCSLAIVVLIFFCTWSGLSESTRGPLGFALAAVLVAIGVSLFIINHNRTKKWEWIEKEPFDTAYGVGGMAKQRRDAFQTSYTTNLVTSAVLLIAAIVLFALTDLLANSTKIDAGSFVALGFAVASISVFLLTRNSIINDSFHSVLQDGKRSPEDKMVTTRLEPIMSIYWMLMVFLYLLISFTTDDWNTTWVIWPVAGVRSVLLSFIVAHVMRRKMVNTDQPADTADSADAVDAADTADSASASSR